VITLRIYASLADAPGPCEWSLAGPGAEPVRGRGRLAEVPQRASRVQLVLPAHQVLFCRARLPASSRRRTAAVLAYAIEERLLADPERCGVTRLGDAEPGGEDVLTVVDRDALQRWLDALAAAGFDGCEVQSESLLLPLREGAWTVGWNGVDGWVRTGRFEAVVLDAGTRDAPPVGLRLLVARAARGGTTPGALDVVPVTADAAPDPAAWSAALGLPVQVAPACDWRRAPPDAGYPLLRGGGRWRALERILPRLRPAAWIAGAALLLHGIGLGIDWAMLASERRTLRADMEASFRQRFPDAVAVVDPALQMRRKLAETRAAANVADTGDFLPMIEAVALALRDQAPGNIRLVSYEGGRLTLELAVAGEGVLQRLQARLREAGFRLDASPARGPTPGAAPVVLTVRPA
jgi:general secretion pathway protein L